MSDVTEFAVARFAQQRLVSSYIINPAGTFERDGDRQIQGEGMRRVAYDENKNNKRIAFVLVTAVVLVAGYAALTRFDRISGQPEPALEALQPQQDPPAVASATAESDSKQAEAKAAADALAESVRALVAEEQALPPTSHAGTPPSTPASTVDAGGTARSLPNAAAQSPDVVEQATSKIAEAEALLKQGGYVRPPVASTPVSPAQQQRMARITALREQLAETTTDTPRADGASPVPEQQ